ncbi:MAG: hypothetical protein ACXVCH_17705 [Bdellovibrionota bacterium]
MIALNLLKTHRRKLTIAAMAWFALSCISYGMALRSVGNWKTSPGRGGELRGGKITSLSYDSFLSGGGVRFKLTGFPLEFVLPPKFLIVDSWPANLQLGAQVELKSTFEGIVFEMNLDPGTMQGKMLALWSQSLPKYEAYLDSRMSAGTRFLVAGALLALAALGLLFFKAYP